MRFNRKCSCLYALILAGVVVARLAAAENLWRPAPPAPALARSERHAELATRRAEVMKRLGANAMLLLFSAEARVYTGDTDYHYRQENNLYYLTGIQQDNATLLLLPGATQTREILFMPKPIPSRETWTGHMLTVEEAQAISGVKEVWDAALMNSVLATLMPRAATALSPRGPAAKPDEKQLEAWHQDFGPLIETITKNEGELYLLNSSGFDSREYRRERAFLAPLPAAGAIGVTIKSPTAIFADLRVKKSLWEQRLLQHAADITAEAFMRACALAAPGVNEYELQAEFEYTFLRRGAFWGYPCIIGGGANSTTLHYQTNRDVLPSGGVLLMDCGAEYDHYTVDITRTIPISGKFTKEQADLYRIVYEAQAEAIKLCRPGNFIGGRRPGQPADATVQGKATEIIKEGLLRLGLITSKENAEYRNWFMHGTCHWIGMNVHDVGSMAGMLAPGQITTVEPGIYIRPDALDVLPKTEANEKFIAAVRPAFEKYKGIGVRIEDDVLVTEGEPRVISASVPSKLEEVETMIARLRAEVRRSGTVGERSPLRSAAR